MRRLRKCRVCGERKGMLAYTPTKGKIYAGEPTTDSKICNKCRTARARAREKERKQWRKHGRPCRQCGELRDCPAQIGVANNAICTTCQHANKAQNARRRYMRNPQAYAAACRRWRELNPGKAADATRRWRQAVLADPERHREYLENRRIYEKIRRAQQGAQTRPAFDYEHRNGKVPYGRNGARVPADPLVPLIIAWMGVDGSAERRRERHGENVMSAYAGQVSFAGIEELAKLAGVSARRIYGILHDEQQNVARDTADKLCSALAIPLALVYPEHR